MSVTTCPSPRMKIDGRRRLVFWSILFTNFVVWLDVGKFSLLTPFWAADLALSPAKIASISSAYLLGYFPMLFTAGVLSDWLGPRRMLLICLAGVTVLGISMAFVTTYEEMYWRNLVFGVFFGFLWAPCQRMLAVWFPAIETAKVTASWVASMMITGIAAPIISLPIATHFSWQSAFIVVSLFGIPAMLAIWFLTSDRPADMKGISEAELRHIAFGQPHVVKSRLSIREILAVFKNRSVILMALAAGLATTPTWLIGTWGTYGLITLENVDPDLVTYLLPAAGIIPMLYALVHGRAVVSVFRGCLRPAMLTGVLIAAGGFLSAGLLKMPWPLWVFAISSLGYMVNPLFWGSLNTYWVGIARPEATGTLNGIAASLQVALGYVMVRLSGSWLNTQAEGLGQLDKMWIIGGVVFLITIVPTLLSREVQVTRDERLQESLKVPSGHVA